MSIRFKPKGGGDASGAAGGVLSGTYPNPAFAVDMATQAELDAVAAAGGGGGDPIAAHHDLKIVSFDPLLIDTGLTGGDGLFSGVRMHIPEDTYSTIHLAVSGALVTPTAAEDNKAAIYRVSDGALIASTADLATVVNAIGTYAVALTAAAGHSLAPLPAGDYYVGAVWNATTRPSLRAKNATQQAEQLGLGSGFRAVSSSPNAFATLPATLGAVVRAGQAPLYGIS